MGGRHGKQRHIAVDPGEGPAVVGVELPAVAAGGDADDEHVVGAGFERVGHVEGDGIVGAGPGADLGAVHPRVEAVEHAVEMEKYALAGPAGRHREGAAVKPRAGGEFLRAVDRLGKTLQFPMTRDGDGGPEVGLIRRGAFVGGNPGTVVEVPLAVERAGRRAGPHRVDLPGLGGRPGRLAGEDQGQQRRETDGSG